MVTTIAHPAGGDTLRLIRAAAAHGAPTLFHCGDEPLATPFAIARAAEACPEATIILGHMGGYFHVDDAIEAVERYPNLVLETSAMPTRRGFGRPSSESAPTVSSMRATAWRSPRIEVEKVRLAGLDADSERLVPGENSARLLDAVR